MSEQQQQNEVVALEDLDLSTVDISYTLFNGVQPLATVMSIEQVDNSRSGRSLQIKLALDQETMNTAGRMVPAGFVITDRINLTASGKRTKDSILRDIAMFQAAVLKLDKTGAPFQAEELVGKQVKLALSTDPDKQDPAKIYQRIGYRKA